MNVSGFDNLSMLITTKLNKIRWNKSIFTLDKNLTS